MCHVTALCSWNVCCSIKIHSLVVKHEPTGSCLSNYHLHWFYCRSYLASHANLQQVKSQRSSQCTHTSLATSAQSNFLAAKSCNPFAPAHPDHPAGAGIWIPTKLGHENVVFYVGKYTSTMDDLGQVAFFLLGSSWCFFSWAPEGLQIRWRTVCFVLNQLNSRQDISIEQIASLKSLVFPACYSNLVGGLEHFFCFHILGMPSS